MHAFNQRILAEDLVRIRRPDEREFQGIHWMTPERIVEPSCSLCLAALGAMTIETPKQFLQMPIGGVEW